MADEQVLIGIIGGSGLYALDNLTVLSTSNPLTPWGHPSAPLTIASLPSGTRVAFLARHGHGHTVPPSAVPARANIAALKSLGVKVILAFSAVGSLREEICPGSFALPGQIIDRTKGVRKGSFFEDTSVVAHAMFGDPFTNNLVDWLYSRVEEVLKEEGKGRKVFKDKTIVCMEGPAFSTRAESRMYRQWGGDLINMSVLPEAKLAREAEVGYALVAMATDYDSWRQDESAVTAHDVFQTLKDNGATAKLIVGKILDELQAALVEEEAGQGLLKEQGGMKFSIMPRSHRQNVEDRKKLAYVLPEYFAGEEGADVANA